MNKKIKLSDALDYAIKANEKDHSEGYNINGNTYYNYLSNESFKAFLDSMPEDVKIMYGEGAGSEIKERKNKNGIIAYPPKMASFGSSSRMIYELTKNEPYFGYEIKLPTTVGGTANLDGYTFTPEKHIYIEAKCRELYSRKSTSVSTAYKEFYEYLNKASDTEITCDMPAFNQKKKTMNATFQLNGMIIEHFDIKQMLCHLLGIGTGLLNDELRYKPVKFLYLIYNPEELHFENVETKNKICSIYHQTCNEAKASINKELFRVILRYLKEKYYPRTSADIDMLADSFEFEICTQDNFIEKMNKTSHSKKW